MKYTIEQARKKSVFKLLWAMYEDLLEESRNPSARDDSGTIISWYAHVIEERLTP